MTPNTVSYGTRRVWRDLRAEGIPCGLQRIEPLTRLRPLKDRPRQRRLAPGLGERRIVAVAANVLDRGFAAPAPNRKWIEDITSVWTAEDLLHVAAVIDLFSRRAVGWSVNAAEERFLSSPKTGRTADKPYRTRGNAKAGEFDHIERFNNAKRGTRQSAA